MTPMSPRECDHIGCPNGCTTRTGMCPPCIERLLADAVGEVYAGMDGKLAADMEAARTDEVYDYIRGLRDELAALRPTPEAS